MLNHELEFDLNNPYIPTKDEVISMLDEIDDATGNEPIEVTDNVPIGNMVVDKV